MSMFYVTVHYLFFQVIIVLTVHIFSTPFFFSLFQLVQFLKWQQMRAGHYVYIVFVFPG